LAVEKDPEVAAAVLVSPLPAKPETAVVLWMRL
jgi:hypothetical protein